MAEQSNTRYYYFGKLSFLIKLKITESLNKLSKRIHRIV